MWFRRRGLSLEALSDVEVLSRRDAATVLYVSAPRATQR